MAFEKWQVTAAQMAKEQFQLGGAMKRMLNRHLSMAFVKWQATAAQMAKEQFPLGGAMTRLIICDECGRSFEDYDVAVLHEVLHHCVDLNIFLKPSDYRCLVWVHVFSQEKRRERFATLILKDVPSNTFLFAANIL